MYDQMSLFFDQIFWKLQCGFRKVFSVEQCLIHMIEKWRKYLDTGGHGKALLTSPKLLIVWIINYYVQN